MGIGIGVVLLFGGVISGFILCLETIGKNQQKKIRQWRDNYYKFYEFYGVLNQWLNIRQRNKNVGEYLLMKNYNTIAIYGMKELGEALLLELKNTDVIVKYAIDRNAEDIFTDIKMFRPDDELEKVDAVIVTAIHWFDEIEMELKDKMDCPILSIDDVVYEV